MMAQALENMFLFYHKPSNGLREGILPNWIKNDRQNSHDGESYFNSDQLSEDSFSLAGYLDLGFKTSLNESLDAYFGVGLGYFHTRSKIPTKLEDDGFYGTGSLGLSWNLSEVFAFRLGYRTCMTLKCLHMLVKSV